MAVRFLSDSSGDWTAMYVAGRKVHEGHRLSPERALRLAGIDVLPTVEVEVPDDHDYSLDAFPDAIDMKTGKSLDDEE